MKQINISTVAVIVSIFLFPILSFGEEKKQSTSDYDIPSHVLPISKENTFPNSTEDQEIVEPSTLTKSLMDDIDIPIKNQNLIKMLNETTLKPSPLAIGYRGMIYLGRWPINYKSMETNINWEFQHINKNEANNTSGNQAKEIYYNQQSKKEIKGALTNKIMNPHDIKKMMLLTAKEKTNLPLSFHTTIGENTKKENTYNIPPEKYGTLQAYAPAVNEKGQVTFGEVYIELKGSNKSIVIKNVTKQGIGAWIPIQDHISFSFQLK
ncbi:YfkD family protein [Virgibacillus sp. W0430]|uniref:YfkD family protein n=1 Tax=Virgibacillus sp. W0430 TaxID=3391580 RepID=UPI003F46EF30